MADCFIWSPAAALACALGWQCSKEDAKKYEDEEKHTITSPFQKPLVVNKTLKYKDYEHSFYQGAIWRPFEDIVTPQVEPRAEITPLLAHHVLKKYFQFLSNMKQSYVV